MVTRVAAIKVIYLLNYLKKLNILKGIFSELRLEGFRVWCSGCYLAESECCVFEFVMLKIIYIDLCQVTLHLLSRLVRSESEEITMNSYN